MSRFAFEARDRQGRVVRGTREAPSASELGQALRARDLAPTSIRPAPQATPPAQAPLEAQGAGQAGPAQYPAATMAVDLAKPGFLASPARGPAPGPGPRGSGSVGALPGVGAGFVAAAPATGAPSEERDWTSRANAMQVSLYFRQAHALLHAGSSISHALAVAARHDASPSLRRASERMGREAACGTPWSESMRRYPGLFSELAIGLVAAGEASGRVDEACHRLAGYAERDYELQQTIKRETWYPKLLVACSVLIPSAVPLVLSGRDAWWASVQGQLLAIGLVAVAWRALQWASPLMGQAKSLSRMVDGLKLSIPVAGKVSRGFASAKFCRALGATIGAGVPVNRAMSLAAGACGNAALAESAERARLQVLEGDTLTGALSATRQFPPVAMQMLATGEASGQTEEQLDKVAVFLEGNAETAVKQAVKLLAVLVLLLVCWQIGSQIMSMYGTAYEAPMDSLINES